MRGPRPVTKKQQVAIDKRRKIYDLRKQGYSWDEVAAAMGLAADTVETYYRQGVKRGEFEAFELPGAGHKLDQRDPESVAAFIAEAAVIVDDDSRFAKLREACKEAGMKPTLIASLIKRLKTTYAGVVNEARNLSIDEMKDALEKKLSLVFDHIDPYSVAQASLKDLSIAANIFIEKHQLLSQKPTHIIDFNSRQQLHVLMPAMLAEAKRRGITLEGEAQVVDGPR